MYMLFFGNVYYPSGGANDLNLQSDNLSDVAERLDQLYESSIGTYFDWWYHVYDTTTEQIISYGSITHQSVKDFREKFVGSA